MQKKILFVHYGDAWLRGSEHCLINLITHLDRSRFTPVVWTNNPCLRHVMLRNQVPCELDDFPLLLGWRAPRWNVAGWMRLVKKGAELIRSRGIDLVHINSGAPCQWMNLASRIAGVPSVTQLHSDYLLRDRLSLGLHLSPHTITVSRAISQKLFADGYPPTRLTVIPNGINTKELLNQPEINIRQKLGLSPSAKVMITVGSLIHRKGIDRLIRAQEQLQKQFPELHLVIIGNGPEREILEQQARGLNVHFAGEQEQVMGWLRSASLFVLGSREEAFGLVCAEASLAGLAVVAPDTGGVPEIVENRRTGLLYRSELQLVQQILFLLRHPKAATELGQTGRQKVLSGHTLAINQAAIEKLWLSQMQPSAAPGFFSVLRPVRQLITRRASA